MLDVFFFLRRAGPRTGRPTARQELSSYWCARSPSVHTLLMFRGCLACSWGSHENLFGGPSSPSELGLPGWFWIIWNLGSVFTGGVMTVSSSWWLVFTLFGRLSFLLLQMFMLLASGGCCCIQYSREQPLQGDPGILLTWLRFVRTSRIICGMRSSTISVGGGLLSEHAQASFAVQCDWTWPYTWHHKHCPWVVSLFKGSTRVFWSSYSVSSFFFWPWRFINHNL